MENNLVLRTFSKFLFYFSLFFLFVCLFGPGSTGSTYINPMETKGHGGIERCMKAANIMAARKQREHSYDNSFLFSHFFHSMHNLLSCGMTHF